MLMLVSPENNSNSPVSGLPVVPAPVAPPPPADAVPAAPTKKRRRVPRPVVVGLLLILFVSAVSGAYWYGKSQRQVIVQSPPTEPLNLPAQAVVLSECAPGRGKQYIIPKDIPLGPIYDVKNDKVIAIEYNFELNQVQADPEFLSNTILELTRKYPVDHFSLVPGGDTTQPLKSFHLVMFVVPKTEAQAITCS